MPSNNSFSILLLTMAVLFFLRGYSLLDVLTLITIEKGAGEGHASQVKPVEWDDF